MLQQGRKYYKMTCYVPKRCGDLSGEKSRGNKLNVTPCGILTSVMALIAVVVRMSLGVHVIVSVPGTIGQFHKHYLLNGR